MHAYRVDLDPDAEREKIQEMVSRRLAAGTPLPPTLTVTLAGERRGAAGVRGFTGPGTPGNPCGGVSYFGAPAKMAATMKTPMSMTK